MAILIKPILTEKATASNEVGKFSFIVKVEFANKDVEEVLPFWSDSSMPSKLDSDVYLPKLISLTKWMKDWTTFLGK